MKDDPCFPNIYRDIQRGETLAYERGLTKREYFIGQALVGCCAAMRPEYLDQVSAGDKGGIHPVRAAITIADKLLAVLEQEAKP